MRIKGRVIVPVLGNVGNGPLGMIIFIYSAGKLLDDDQSPSIFFT